MSLVRRVLFIPSCLRFGALPALGGIQCTTRSRPRPLASYQLLPVTLTWRLLTTSGGGRDSAVPDPPAPAPAQAQEPLASDPVVKLWHFLFENKLIGVPSLDKWATWLSDEQKAVVALDLTQALSWISKARRPEAEGRNSDDAAFSLIRTETGRLQDGRGPRSVAEDSVLLV